MDINKIILGIAITKEERAGRTVYEVTIKDGGSKMVGDYMTALSLAAVEITSEMVSFYNKSMKESHGRTNNKGNKTPE